MRGCRLSTHVPKSLMKTQSNLPFQLLHFASFAYQWTMGPSMGPCPAPDVYTISMVWRMGPHLIFTSWNWVTSSPAPHQTRACILHEIYQVFYREVPVCLEAAPDLQVYDVDAKAELVPESAPANPKPSCTNCNYSFFSNKFQLHIIFTRIMGQTNHACGVYIYIYIIHIYMCIS